MFRKLALWFCLSSLLLLFANTVFAVNVTGNVTYDGVPVCSMVLANGQYMFTCSGDGSFDLDVPLDPNGEITVFAFCSGLAPYKQTITPDQGTGMQIHMLAGEAGAGMEVDYSIKAMNTTWALVEGTLTYNSAPICAMALANGQYMFSCSGDGSFSLLVPLDPMGSITLFGFCEGLPPYEILFTTNEIDFHADYDQDGYTVAEGDTNDFNSAINPGVNEEYNSESLHPGDWRIRQIEYDNNNDSIIDDVAISTYNSAGNYLRGEDLEWGNNIRYYTYDEQGRKIKREYDDDRDGSINSSNDYSYDLNGYMVEETTTYNGSPSLKIYYTYDSYGNITSTLKYRFDNGIVGDLYEGINYYYDPNTYSYDSNNQPIRMEYDDSRVGAINEIVYFTYNSFGFIQQIDSDNDNDGSIDSTKINSFDASGNWTGLDYYNSDDSLVRSYSFSYDALDNIRLNMSYASDPWFIWEDTSVGQRYVESIRLRFGAEIDSNGNGLIDEVVYYTFNADGLWETAEYDNNNDGLIDAVEHYTWIR